MDLSLISGALAVAKGALGLVNDAADAAGKLNDHSILDRLNQARLALNDLIGKHGELSIEFIQAKAEIEELKRQLRETAEVEHYFGVYFRKRDDGSLDGPFCTKTWDHKKVLARLKFSRSERYGGDRPALYFFLDEGSNYHRVPREFLVQSRTFSDQEVAFFDLVKNPAVDMGRSI